MKSLTQLTILIAVLSLFAGLTDPWFRNYFNVMTISDWLGLSYTGLNHLYLWQIFTWAFLEPSYDGISFSFLINLIFYLYFLWMLGSSVITNLGEQSFFRFFIATTLFFGVLSAAFILATGSYITLMGLTTFLFALFVVFVLMNSENELLLFFLVPIKTKWLFLLVAGGTFLIALSKWSLFFFLLYPGALLWGYLYGIVVLGLWSPFLALNPFENWLHHWRSWFTKGQTVVEDASKKIKGKVIDLHTGQPVLEDEEFLEEMLDKISKHGEDSLSWSERHRLNEISKRRPPPK